MSKIIRPFGLFGPSYRTDLLGALLFYACFMPTVILVGMILAGMDPISTGGGWLFYALTSSTFVGSGLFLALKRSERIR